MLEAEVKLALDESAGSRLRARLADLGATPLHDVRQVDVYFAHPLRDFAATDEALRLRLEDGAVRITYKGAKLDPPLKTREEIELGIEGGIDAARTLLERLGFRAVATVAKEREEHRLPGATAVVVSLDRVEGLGTFCEVETSARTPAEGRAVLTAALEALELDGRPPIVASYLELLLDRGTR